jgi:hypothetical protein
VTDDTASTEMERDDAVEGRVFTNGVAQEVTREGDLVRISLTCIPGRQPEGTTYGPVQTIKFPEPVTVEAGKSVAVSIEWLPEPERDDTSAPMFIRQESVLTSVTTMPSAVRPGHQQAAVADASLSDGALLPDLFTSRMLP